MSWRATRTYLTILTNHSFNLLIHAHYRWTRRAADSESAERAGRAAHTRSRQAGAVQQPWDAGHWRAGARAFRRERRAQSGMSEPWRGIGDLRGEIPETC